MATPAMGDWILRVRKGLTTPKTRREEREAHAELKARWHEFEPQLVDLLRAPDIDEEAAALGYRPRKPRELVIEAILQRPTPERVNRLLFLLRVPDRKGAPIPHADFLRLAGEPCRNVVSRWAMRWLRQHVSEWVAFAALAEPTLKRLRRRRA